MSASQWRRPFVASYSSHTACFCAIQILLLSRIFSAIETEYTLKLHALLACDILSVIFVIIGIIRTFPYLKSVFQEKEIVVDNGPSLITEIIPNFILCISVLTVSVVVGIADYTILQTVTIRYAFVIYGLIGIGGLVFSIYSVESYKERVLTSSTLVCVCVSGTEWFSDWTLLLPVSISLLLWSYFSWKDMSLTVLSATESEVLRVRSIFLLILVLAICTSAVNPFGVPVLVAVGACNCFRYIQDRRLGTIHERISMRALQYQSIP
jgi:hypothetical protein